MPTNTTEQKKKRTFKVKVKAPKEKLYKVTLTLSFTPTHGSSDEIEKDEGWRGDETNTEFCKRIQDWNETEKLYGTKEKIERHLKSMDVNDYVEYLPPGEVLSAKWLDGLRLSFVMKPESPEYESVAKIKDWLESYSLEDGEYESSGDNGWTMKTVGGLMEYGLTDFRESPIIVEEVSTAVLTGGRRKALRKTRRQTRRRR